MHLFNKYINNFWPKSSYVIIGKNLSEEKSSSWVELFLDLSFVIAISILSSAIISGASDFISLLIFTFSFMMLFIVWRSSTFYNQIFFTNSVKNRIIMFGYIFSALFLVVFTIRTENIVYLKFYESSLIYLLITVAVHFFMGWVWFSSWKSLYSITKQNDTYSIRSLYWAIIYFFSGFLIFLMSICALFIAEYIRVEIIYFFGAVVTFELFAVVIQERICRYFLTLESQKHGSKSVYSTDHVDAGHTMERFGLFMLLIIGEMFLGVTVAIKTPEVMSAYNLSVFVLLVISIFGIFWVYFDQVLSYTFKDNLIAQWTVVQFFISLNLLFMASFNREIILNFSDYYMLIHTGYVVFFTFLIFVSKFIDTSAQSSRMSLQLDISHVTGDINRVRILTVLLLIPFYFFPITNSLLYAIFIVTIFIFHSVYGLYSFYRSLEIMKKKRGTDG